MFRSLNRTALLGVLILAAATPSLQAQGPEGPPPGGRQGPPRPPSVTTRVERLKGELGLDAAQAAKIRTVLQAADADQQKLMEQGRTDADSLREKMDARRLATDSAIGVVLTAEQKVKFAAMRRERMEPPRDGERGPRRGPPGGQGPQGRREGPGGPPRDQ